MSRRLKTGTAYADEPLSFIRFLLIVSPRNRNMNSTSFSSDHNQSVTCAATDFLATCYFQSGLGRLAAIRGWLGPGLARRSFDALMRATGLREKLLLEMVAVPGIAVLFAAGSGPACASSSMISRHHCSRNPFSN